MKENKETKMEEKELIEQINKLTLGLDKSKEIEFHEIDAFYKGYQRALLTVLELLKKDKKEEK